jgi:hypothetical protein
VHSRAAAQRSAVQPARSAPGRQRLSTRGPARRPAQVLQLAALLVLYIALGFRAARARRPRAAPAQDGLGWDPAQDDLGWDPTLSGGYVSSASASASDGLAAPGEAPLGAPLLAGGARPPWLAAEPGDSGDEARAGAGPRLRVPAARVRYKPSARHRLLNTRASQQRMQALRGTTRTTAPLP